MKIEPRIVQLQEKKLVGMKMIMSVYKNKTASLWQAFMSRRGEIKGQKKGYYYSLQVYDEAYFRVFDPHRDFTKWAAVEVSRTAIISEGMESLLLSAGKYAVFHYKGLPGDPQIFQFIYSEWLPQSGYKLDHRPHFEILGANYRSNDPTSEEEIWIPLKD